MPCLGEAQTRLQPTPRRRQPTCGQAGRGGLGVCPRLIVPASLVRGIQGGGSAAHRGVRSWSPSPVQTAVAHLIAILHVGGCSVFIHGLMTWPCPRVLGEVRRRWTSAFEHPGVKHQGKVTRAGRPPDTAAPASASAITATLLPADGN